MKIEIWCNRAENVVMQEVMNLILNLGSVVNAGFDQILVLYSPKVYPSADIIDTLVYRITLQSEGGGATNYPLGAAIGLFKSVISLIMIE